LQKGKVMISQQVKDKLAEVIELWADDNIEGRPALLANATYATMLQTLEAKTEEIAEAFPQ
jgi:hypothetical protein